ncbi:MAG: ParB N-terminal domain-containing protein [Bacteroidales bacterium]|nr:ParB N-terminal domain-containing protein [Bacteroidales bacterium]
MKLVKVALLKHIEGFSKNRVENMKKKMFRSCIWEKPICIEKNHYLVLDGQHRFEVALKIGLKYIPCELFDYNDDEVVTWSLRKEYIVSKKMVIERALNGNIYPYKTAKHKFSRKIEKCNISLNELEKYNKYIDDIIEYDFI